MSDVHAFALVYVEPKLPFVWPRAYWI